MMTPSERELTSVPAQEPEVDMAIWARPPASSKGALDRAGRALASMWNDTDLDLIDSWRAAHGFPLNTFQTNLRYRARRADPSCLVAQRLKRLASIKVKLERFDKMQLSSMQDIGGCRAILRDLEAVERVRNTYVDDGCRVRNDYIQSPKEDGYRGIHIIGKYNTDSEVHAVWNGYSIEIQLRTRLQHAFATAVEVVGTMTGGPIKTGDGDPRWRRFFALAGSAFAIIEKTPLVPGTPHDEKQIAEELITLGHELHIGHHFPAWTEALKRMPTKRVQGVRAYVLILDLDECTISVVGCRTPTEASALVLQREKDALKTNKRVDVLRAFAGSIADLRRAYPNYEMDTEVFYSAIQKFTADARNGQ